MNIRIVFTSFLILSSVTYRSIAEDPVYFADPVLKASVEEKLKRTNPTAADMEDLGELDVRYNSIAEPKITNLTGLEYAVNLQRLILRGNSVTNISPIVGLNKLVELDLSDNQVSNISALSSMTQLRVLDVHGNGISSISALSNLTSLEKLVVRLNNLRGGVWALENLTNLEELNIADNDINGISGLHKLTKLRRLYLFGNAVRNIDVLANFPMLERLELQNNYVSDITSLTELTHLRRLFLEGNPLDQEAYCADLQTIVDNNPGITLTHDSQYDPPDHVQVSADPGGPAIHLTWDEVCNGVSYTSYYRVYRATSAAGPKAPMSSWRTSTVFEDTTVTSDTTYWYWVQTALSAQGLNAGDYSEPVTAEVESIDPELTLSSTAGGTVALPGEGVFHYTTGDMVSVQAVPMDVNLFVFAGWTGSAVEAGKVADSNAASTLVTVDSQYTLKARFLAVSNTLIVDGATPDPNGKGTQEQPFARIQEAIDVAGQGASIRVQPGTYVENLDLSGKNIQLIGMDPNSPAIKSYPVIDGNDKGPAIRYAAGEGPECLLLGFTLTRGRPAIECRDSSPLLGYCLIVGNRSADPNSGAIELVNSQAMFFNCTIADNLGGAQGAGFVLTDSSVLMSESILWNNAPMELQVNGTGALMHSYSNIGNADGLQSGIGRINADPLFAAPGLWNTEDAPPVWIEGDYHLQSQAGRWDPVLQTWLTDNADSPCIDTGDPLTPVGLEPNPNGGVINMGAYGGTSQASLSN